MKLVVGINCAPCAMLKSWLVENNIDVETVLAQENMDYARAHNIRTVPTLVLEDGTTISNVDEIKKHFTGGQAE